MAAAVTSSIPPTSTQPSLYQGPVLYRPILSPNHCASLEESKPPTFDPAIHLAYTPPSAIHTMADLGFPADTGISPHAITEAFPLFSPAAMAIMRAEIFSPAPWQNCLFVSGNSTAVTLRGHCPSYAPFTHAAMTHPRTLEIVSRNAGVDLVPVMDYEVGPILFASTPESALAGRAAWGKADGAKGQVTNWHKDHYPFVCVLMLSDVAGMVGGETAIKLPGGGEDAVRKIRGPEMGCATVMQGRYIEHQALAAEGVRERITMVCSFRPADPMVPDDSHLRYIGRISEPSELYYQWADYRLDILEQRIRIAREQMRRDKAGGVEFDVPRSKQFLGQQVEHLTRTSESITPISEVLSGRVHDGMEILNAAVWV